MSAKGDRFDDGVLTLSATRSNDGVSILLRGELDMAATERFLAFVRDTLVDGLHWVEIDGSELTFMDSSGVTALLTAKREVEEAGIRFRVGATVPAVRRLLEIAGVTEELGVDVRDTPREDSADRP